MKSAIIEFKHVSKIFYKGLVQKKSKIVFEDISFYINQGEICGLFGTSGCGKSTCLRIFMELLTLSGGEVFYHGKNLNTYNKLEKKQIHKEVQIVFQDPSDAFHPKWRIMQSLIEPLKIFNVYTRDEFEKELKQYLSLLGLEESFLQRYPYQLSGGQIQRLAFVRVLLLKPKVIFLDEATSMLDVSVQAQFMTIVKKLNQHLGITFVIISHDKALVAQLCDRVYAFENQDLQLRNPKELLAV